MSSGRFRPPATSLERALPVSGKSYAAANVQGVAWMLLAGAAFAASNVEVRFASQEMHPFAIVFFRSAIAVLLLAHVFLGREFEWRPGARLKLHLIRGVLQTAALLCLYAAIAITPLATVIAIAFITPIISAAGATLFMGEPSRLNRWAAVMLGFFGMLVIVRPGIIAITLGIGLLLAYAVQQAVSNLIAKALTKHESAASVVAWMTLLSTPLTLIPALFVWSWPTLIGWGHLLAIAVLSTVAHLATTQAYRLADITIADPLIFFRLIAAAFFGYVFFSEVPDGWTWLGSAIILAAATILGRERRSRGP